LSHRSVIIDFYIRWNYTYLSCERLLELFPYINDSILALRNDVLVEQKNIPALITDQEKKQLKEFIEFLEPFYDCTLQMEKKGLGISHVWHSIKVLIESIQNVPRHLTRTSEIIREDLKEILDSMDKSYLISAYLHPVHRLRLSEDEMNSAKKEISEVYKIPLSSGNNHHQKENSVNFPINIFISNTVQYLKNMKVFQMEK
jgi:hypothetical protein